MSTTMPIERPRIAALRRGILEELPRVPNNRASLQALKEKSLGALLIDFLSWRMRFVGREVRSIVIEPSASNDRRWATQQEVITAFLQKVAAGEDLTPHLSLQIRSRGFAPAAANRMPDVDRWIDKDFLLTVMGYHHFHLSAVMEPSGFATRGDLVLFACVTRTQFTVMGLFDHSVFDPGSPEAVTPERTRLWQIFDEHRVRGIPPGSVVVTPIATSGHSLAAVFTAQKYAQFMTAFDPEIDTPSFQTSFFAQAGGSAPAKSKWQWRFWHLDLSIREARSGRIIIMRRMPD